MEKNSSPAALNKRVDSWGSFRQVVATCR